MKLATIPLNAAGRTTFEITSALVHPSPNAASRRTLGTAVMASSQRLLTRGSVMKPTTMAPAAALAGLNSGKNGLRVGRIWERYSVPPRSPGVTSERAK